MAIVVFVLGHAGSGKTKLSKHWVKSRVKKGEPWVLLDKDICGEGLANALMASLGLDPNDRDSLAYKAQVRDLEYQGCLRLAREQLKLGLNVVMPGPWNKELANGNLFDAHYLSFPEGTSVKYLYVKQSLSNMKKRIIERKSPRDGWKLENWREFEKTLSVPQAVIVHKVPILDMESILEKERLEFMKDCLKAGDV